MQPSFGQQLPHSGIYHWKPGATFLPAIQRIVPRFVPGNIQAYRIGFHFAVMGIMHRHGVEVFPPNQLAGNVIPSRIFILTVGLNLFEQIMKAPVEHTHRQATEAQCSTHRCRWPQQFRSGLGGQKVSTEECFLFQLQPATKTFESFGFPSDPLCVGDVRITVIVNPKILRSKIAGLEVQFLRKYRWYRTELDEFETRCGYRSWRLADYVDGVLKMGFFY